MADSGSGSSVSGGLDMGRERLQSNNQYSYLGQDSQTNPLADLGSKLMDVFNQSNAQSNLLFGGPGYAGSFVPRGGTPAPGGGGTPAPGGGGTPAPGGGGTPAPGGGTPGPANPNPGTPVQKKPAPGTPPPAGGPIEDPGQPPVYSGSGGTSDAQLAQLQKSIPGAYRLPNGNITWPGRVQQNYGVQPGQGGGADTGEDPRTTAARIQQIANGNLSPGGSGGPGYGGAIPPPTPTPAGGGPGPTGTSSYAEAAPDSGAYAALAGTPTPGATDAIASPAASALSGVGATPDQGIDQTPANPGPSQADLEAMFPGTPASMAAASPGGGASQPAPGGSEQPGGPAPSPGSPGAPGTPGSGKYSPPYAAGMDPRFGTWNSTTGTYDMSVPLQDQSKFPVHDPNYNPLDPTWKYYTEQAGNTYRPLDPNQRNDEDWAGTSPITPQGSNINDAWSTSPGWRPEAPEGGLYGGYTGLTAEGPTNDWEAMQQGLSGLMATGKIGGVDDPTVKVLMDAWAKEYNQPGYSDTAKAAISQEGMLGARGAADANSANIMSMAKRTNNPMATYGALGDVARGESQALGSNARKNAIDFENAARADQQQARVGYQNTIDPALTRQQQGVGILGATNKQELDRRMQGYQGLNDLYKNQQTQNNSLLQQLQSLYSTRASDNTELGKTTGQGGLSV